MRLNGTTGENQLQRHTSDPFESLEDSLNRIEHALNLVIYIVGGGYFTPSKAEEEYLQDGIGDMLDPRKEVLDLSDCEPRCEELYLRTLAQLDRLKELTPQSEAETPIEQGLFRSGIVSQNSISSISHFELAATA